MAKLFASGLITKSGSVVPQNKIRARRFLADLDRNIAIFGLGNAFLGVQITNLEDRCVANARAPEAKAVFD